MFEYIFDKQLQPARPYAVRKKTDLIIVHNVGGVMSVEDIHKMHIAKGNRGIDYNIYIDLDGKTYWGRGLQYEGGHVNNKGKTAGMNARSVGIVCNGNFNTRTMPSAQYNALCRVTADVVRYYKLGSINQVKSHKEVAGAWYTDCPGKNFPMEELRKYIKNGAGTLEPQPGQPASEYPPTYVVTVSELNFREKASMSSRVRKVLKRGDKVKLDRYVKGEKWARVYVDGALGYVWLSYIGEK